MVKYILRKIVPLYIRKLIRNFWLLSECYAQRKSMMEWKCIDKDGNDIPWYTYPAIEYLLSLDFSESVVLEFGSGGSSIWWSNKAKMVTTIEHNKSWFEKTSNGLIDNLEIILAETELDYLDAAKGKKFDVIIIDGVYRHECAISVSELMSSNGLVILDNSDWYPETAKFLRENLDLLQVDFYGFGPINNYTWTTSLFFSRGFVCIPAESRLPGYSVGAVRNVCQ